MALTYRLLAGPPLAERCKDLFAALWNQLSSACCPNSPQERTQASPSSMSEVSINHADRNSGKTVPMRPVVANPVGVMRRRLAKAGYLNVLDNE